MQRLIFSVDNQSGRTFGDPCVRNCIPIDCTCDRLGKIARSLIKKGLWDGQSPIVKHSICLVWIWSRRFRMWHWYTFCYRHCKGLTGANRGVLLQTHRAWKILAAFLSTGIWSWSWRSTILIHSCVGGSPRIGCIGGIDGQNSRSTQSIAVCVVSVNTFFIDPQIRIEGASYRRAVHWNWNVWTTAHTIEKGVRTRIHDCEIDWEIGRKGVRVGKCGNHSNSK